MCKTQLCSSFTPHNQVHTGSKNLSTLRKSQGLNLWKLLSNFSDHIFTSKWEKTMTAVLEREVPELHKPNNHPTLAETETLVRKHFAEIYDDSEVPMAEHMRRVYLGVSHIDDEHLHHIAWLHDIVEDTSVTITELISLGYSTEVVEAVALLTKPKKMPYAEYIDALCASGNARALLVKLSDNADNTDPKRWLLLNPFRAHALTKRYAGVREKLNSALGSIDL